MQHIWLKLQLPFVLPPMAEQTVLDVQTPDSPFEDRQLLNSDGLFGLEACWLWGASCAICFFHKLTSVFPKFVKLCSAWSPWLSTTQWIKKIELNVSLHSIRMYSIGLYLLWVFGFFQFNFRSSISSENESSSVVITFRFNKNNNLNNVTEWTEIIKKIKAIDLPNDFFRLSSPSSPTPQDCATWKRTTDKIRKRMRTNMLGGNRKPTGWSLGLICLLYMLPVRSCC